MVNKKGSLGIGIITAITIFIIGMMSINFIMDEVTDARINLSCSDASNISDATKLLCLVVDITVIYWMIIILGIIGGLVVTRLSP